MDLKTTLEARLQIILRELGVPEEKAKLARCKNPAHGDFTCQTFAPDRALAESIARRWNDKFGPAE